MGHGLGNLQPWSSQQGTVCWQFSGFSSSPSNCLLRLESWGRGLRDSSKFHFPRGVVALFTSWVSRTSCLLLEGKFERGGHCRTPCSHIKFTPFSFIATSSFLLSLILYAACSFSPRWDSWGTTASVCTCSILSYVYHIFRTDLLGGWGCSCLEEHLSSSPLNCIFYGHYSCKMQWV